MKYYIGIDGGGTSTKLTLADEEHQVFQHIRAGAFNRNGQSREQTTAVIKDMVEQIKAFGLSERGCLGIGIGVAGISNPEVSSFLREEFVKNGMETDIYLYGDHMTAMAAACPECHGIILIAGTGSICYGIDQKGNEARVGGWGHLIDDCGSAYFIGRNILSAVVQSIDGRSEENCLKNMVFQYLKINSVEELIQFVYAEKTSKKEIAALAPLLEEAIVQNDKTAVRIEEQSVVGLQELVYAVSKKMPGEKTLILAGSVLEQNKRIRDSLSARLQGYRICMPGVDASEGALRLLWRQKTARGDDY